MIQYIAKVWKSILKIGDDPSLPGLERARTMLVNGLTAATSFVVFLFLIGYLIVGYQYYYMVLFFFPPAAYLLYLNHQKKYKAAKALFVVGSISIVTYWSWMSPLNGNEYILIAVATCSSVIFSNRIIAYVINFACLAVFVSIRLYLFYVPAAPDPHINHSLLSTIILIGTVAVLSFQMAFFRDLAHHYDKKLSAKYDELKAALEHQQRTDEELMTTNEELTASNEQLFLLTNQLETIVRQKSAELQSYIDAINVNIYSAVADVSGTIVKINEPLLMASGYCEEELIGKKFNILNSGYHEKSYFTQLWNTILAGKTWRGELKNKRKDSTFFWIEMVILPIKGKTEATDYFLTLSLPITERKINEEAREKTIQVLESVAFSTSHEIRGPLTRMEGLAGLVQKEFINPEEFKWVADQMIITTQELNKATTDLVEFVNTHHRSIQEETR